MTGRRQWIAHQRMSAARRKASAERVRDRVNLAILTFTAIVTAGALAALAAAAGWSVS